MYYAFKGQTMTKDAVQQMIANAPEVSQWWNENKSAVEKSWKFWGKWQTRIHFAASLSFMGVLTVLGFEIYNQSNGVVAYLSVWGVFCVMLGFVIGADARKWNRVAHQHKNASEKWELNFRLFDKEFCDQKRGEVVGGLIALGMDPHQIMSLKNLDLPDCWWHRLHHIVKLAQYDQMTQSAIQGPTLEDVFVQVEAQTQHPTPHVLRL